MADDCRLFVYGTLCDADKRRQILGRFCKTIPAHLHDHAKHIGRWPYILPAPGNSVQGQLILDLNEKELAACDTYEEIEPRGPAVKRQLYTRERAAVTTNDQQTFGCWVYQPYLPGWADEWK